MLQDEMSFHPDEMHDEDWHPNLFPYNLASVAAHSHAPSELPGEPPGYDEFEFSLPSPSFAATHQQQHSGPSPSPSFSSFPSLTSHAASPSAATTAAEAHHDPSPPRQTARSSGDVAVTAMEDRHEYSGSSEQLFRDEELSALDAFFSERLGSHAAGAKRESPDEMDGFDGDAGHEPDMNGTEQDDAEIKTKERTGSWAKAKAGSKRAKLDSTSSTAEGAGRGAGKKAATAASARIPGKLNGTSTPLASASETIAPVSATGAAASLSKRSNHIASEQRRRTTIKENYKSLVDLLLAGEESSGISLSTNGNENGAGLDEETPPTEGKKGSKGKGRGRGRKGQDGAGATKSVVLERAADYLRWLEKTNEELEREVLRVEGILGAALI